MKKIVLFSSLFILLTTSFAFAQGSVTLTTYYPAPYGAYDRLRLVPRAALTLPCQIGTTFALSPTGALQYCADYDSNGVGELGPIMGVWTQNANNVYLTNGAANPNLKVGIGTTTPTAKLTIQDGALLATGVTGATPVAGAGTRFMWIPAKAALRAGFVSSDEWDTANIGSYSIALGNQGKATGTHAIALGFHPNAAGDGSFALGTANTETSGTYSFAFNTGVTTGSQTVAFGLGAGAVRNQTYASFALGRYSMEIGSKTQWIDTEPLFMIGNGPMYGTENNALTVLKNANMGINDYTPDALLEVSAKGLATPDLFMLSSNNDTDGNRFIVKNDGKVGIGTTTPGVRLQIFNSGATTTNDAGIASFTSVAGINDDWSGVVLPAALNGTGKKFIWYPRKAAFRAGLVIGNGWDEANIGNFSIAMGFNTTALLDHSIALGMGALAQRQGAIAIGRQSLAGTLTGDWSIALPGGVTTGNSSFAAGIPCSDTNCADTGAGSATSQAYGSFTFGRFNVLAGNTSQWIATDPLFVIGNGLSGVAPNNALTVLKNGNIGINTASPSTFLHIRDVMRIEPRSTAQPTCNAAAAGSFYVDGNTSNTLCYCNGTAPWTVVSGSGCN